MSSKKRETNLELLRIVAMLMVISLHYLGKGNTLVPFSFHHENVVNEFIAWTLEALSFGAVNLYMMISGYFMINTSGKMERPFKIVVQVLFYSIGVYLVYMVMGRLPDYVHETYFRCKFFLPIASAHYWFASSYVYFCLLAPFLAVGMRRLNKKQHLGLMIIMLLLFSRVWRILLPQSEPLDDKGYGIFWFFTLFVLAAYIRRFVPVKNKRRWLYFGLYILGVVLTLLSMLAINRISKMTGRFESFITCFLEYNSPTIILSSVSLFLFFRTLRIPEGFLTKVILFLSPLTFGIYLAHEHMLLRDLWTEFWKVEDFFHTPYFILHFVGVVLAVFVLGGIIEALRKLLFDLLYKSKPLKWFFEKLGKLDCIFPKKDEDFT